MPDREKVIEGVEHCFHGQECCGDIECPYYIEHLSDCCCLGECQENLKADVLELLKEQEAVVRCKNCHYGIRNSKEDIFCIKAVYNDKYKRPEWFCADGRKKDG